MLVLADLPPMRPVVAQIQGQFSAYLFRRGPWTSNSSSASSTAPAGDVEDEVGPR